MSDLDRFNTKVDKSAPGGCWLWEAGRNGKGYGTFYASYAGRTLLAHRVSYELHIGEIPTGKQIDHICWNTLCVNPQHLRLATNAENSQNLRGANRNSKSGVRGVYLLKRTGRWYAQATLDGGAKHLGYYDTAEEAEAVVVQWRRENMPYSMIDRAAK